MVAIFKNFMFSMSIDSERKELFMKKTLCALLSVVMLLSISVTAFAESTVPSTEQRNTILNISPAMRYDALNANTKSTSVPKEFYDLSQGSYYATLEVVGVSWLYTNYYFYANSDGKLNVTYTIYSDTGRPMKVGLYDLDAKKIVTTWTSSGSTLAGITESFSFINCDLTHRYAVAFVAVFDGFSHDSIHGSATISH